MSKKDTDIPVILSTNIFPVIGIGASAGGLEAFKKLLRAIPENSGMAYVLVQHLDPKYDSALPQLLQKVTKIPVLEITDDIKVQPDHIYIIPSNKMLLANDGILQLSPRPGKNTDKLNLPIDLFFTSLAEVHQAHAIGIVLSGNASDGTLGLKAIKDQGGITFAQDEASAAYNSMPHNAVEAGVVDFILPPELIPQKLIDIKNQVNLTDEELEQIPKHEDEIFKQIISLLRLRKGIDFTYYKQTTIRRRILRRMAISKYEEPATYLAYLRENKIEQDALLQDLLIHVTEFFRDPKVFENLCASVFPQLLKHKTPGDTVRIWVAGCSTGQEAYSIAICLKEFLKDTYEKVQIFATDVNESAIIKARTGVYTKSEVGGISPERLQKFFTKSNSHYQVNKSLRNLCVFAVHNFLNDPPFGKIDLISCRNVLIYMEPYLQKKALSTFHYSMNQNGFLLMGKSETAGSVPNLFMAANKTFKLFTRKDVPGRYEHVASQRSEQTLHHLDSNPKREIGLTDFQKMADEMMLNKYTPPGVVVNDMMDIVHFRGNTSLYLEQAQGKPSHNLLKMAKGGLAFELRNLVHKVKKDHIPIMKDDVLFHFENGQGNLSIEAIPLSNLADPHVLIIFHGEKKSTFRKNQSSKSGISSKSLQDEKDLHILKLEQAILHTHEDMRSITEDQEAANEELQTVNEELLSGSEEMQSLNEELESSKEELQSTNEELTVLNQELTNLNEQLITSRDYAENIISNIREPLLVLDKNLRIKTANNAFYKTFRVNEPETEGVLIYDLGNKQWNIPALRTLLENILPEKSIFNDFEVTHTFSHIGERVMLLNAREVLNKTNLEKLILLSIEDITERKQAEEAERIAMKHFQFIADAMPQKIWTSDANGNLNYFNKCWLDYTGLEFEQLKNWGWTNVIHPDETNETEVRWKQSIANGKNFEMEHRFLNTEGIYKWHLTRGLAKNDKTGKIKMWIGTNTEIEEQKKHEEELTGAVEERTSELQKVNQKLFIKNGKLIKMNKELEAFTYVSSHDLKEPLRKIQTFANLILEKEYVLLSETGKNYFKRINNAASRMQTLIEDLLSYSHMNAGEHKLVKTDLNKIIEAVKSDLNESIAEKNAIIESNNLCNAHIQPFQFHQLMLNLVGNALKFSIPGTPPHIIIKSSQFQTNQIQNENSEFPTEQLSPGKNYCHISVADNGLGFDSQYKDQIFELFQRLYSKEEFPGTGIGLAIVKKIVDNHNGIIKATGELNKGATFDIFIPDDVE